MISFLRSYRFREKLSIGGLCAGKYIAANGVPAWSVLSATSAVVRSVCSRNYDIILYDVSRKMWVFCYNTYIRASVN